MKKIRYSDGDGSWVSCQKCGILYNGADTLPCAGGGNHEPDSYSFVIPFRDPFAIGRPFISCSGCGTLYPKNSDNTKGSCAAGGGHIAGETGTYTVATAEKELKLISDHQRELNSDFKLCKSCLCVYNSKIPGKCLSGSGGMHVDSTQLIMLARFVDYSPWEKVFHQEAASPFPSFNTPSQSLAYAKFNNDLKAKHFLTSQTNDLRDSYKLFGTAVIGQLTGMLSETYQHGPPLGVKRSDWNFVHDQLEKESIILAKTDDYFSGLKSVITNVFIQETWMTNEILAIFDREEFVTLDNGLDFLDFIFSAFGVVLGAILPGAGEAIPEGLKEIIKGAVELSGASIMVSLEQNEHPEWEMRHELSCKAEQVYQELEDRFTQFLDAISLRRTTILGDWGRMRSAEPLLTSWLEPNSGSTLTDLWKQGYRISLYQALFPARFAIVQAVAHNIYSLGPSYREAIDSAIDKGRKKHAFNIIHLGVIGKDANIDDVITYIVKKEAAHVNLALTPNDVYGSLLHSDIFPSKDLMDKLELPNHGVSINKDALFGHYGGWEETLWLDADIKLLGVVIFKIRGS